MAFSNFRQTNRTRGAAERNGFSSSNPCVCPKTNLSAARTPAGLNPNPKHLWLETPKPRPFEGTAPLSKQETLLQSTAGNSQPVFEPAATAKTTATTPVLCCTAPGTDFCAFGSGFQLSINQQSRRPCTSTPCTPKHVITPPSLRGTGHFTVPNTYREEALSIHPLSNTAVHHCPSYSLSRCRSFVATVKETCRLMRATHLH